VTISDKALCKLLDDATVNAGNGVPWMAEAACVYSTAELSRDSMVAEAFGNRDRFHVAALIAHAPALAAEVLRLRMLLRQARKGKVS